MGRILKRVPLDFNWPINKTWEGYINPYKGKECPHCERGYNPATQRIFNEWYGYHKCEWLPNPYRSTARYNKYSWNHNLTQEDVDALIKEERLMDLTHDWTPEEGWKEKKPKYHPTAAEVNEWSLKGMGHDSINCHICVKARAERESVYGVCLHCKGKRTIYESKEIEKKHNKWKETQPPKGKGFQLWEGDSGYPLSPVFKSLEELCDWCEDNAYTFGYEKASAAEWLEMLKEGMVYFKDEDNGIVFM